METIWFCLVAVMVAMYVLLDALIWARARSIFLSPGQAKSVAR